MINIEPRLSYPEDEDPNVRQRRASDPEASVWVGASAGTGKTKVLTDRVLRLLLPRKDDTAGTPAHRILCLTFTKAGAGEMALRIHETLGKWAVMDDAKLREELQKLSGDAPDGGLMKAARRLFAQVVDCPGGLKIMTIHAFCQSVLGRFPVEAGIPPRLNIIEDSDAKELVLQSLRRVITDAELSVVYSRLSVDGSARTLSELVGKVLFERGQLARFFEAYPLPAQSLAAIRRTLNAPTGSEDEILQQFFARLDKGLLKQCADALSSGGKNDQAQAQGLFDWLAEPETGGQALEKLITALVTGDGTARAINKTTIAAHEYLPALHARIVADLLEVRDDLTAIRQAHKIHDLLQLGMAVNREYQRLKDQRAALDYTDLILKVHGLLYQNDTAAQWVMFKLDGGIDHLLIDEAQDTNPEQWEIIAKLSEEFFSGAGRLTQNPRTVFTVGDGKQSIYRFQRAAPEAFERMKLHFEIKVTEAQQKWRDEALNMSFRSTRTVLQFVDAAFADADMARDAGVTDGTVLEHKAWRRRQAGRVELWPLVPFVKHEDRERWAPPVAVRKSDSAEGVLARQVATAISGWIARGEMLESKDRPIRAGDIMVLMRSRTVFVAHLTRELKRLGVPVSGADRMVLSEHIAVQDLLAAAMFALQADDSLSLACLMKSPLMGMGEDDLFALAHGRTDSSLYDAAQHKLPQGTLSWLRGLQDSAALRPSSFFRELLHRPCPADGTSGLRALRARLGDDLLDPLDEFLNALSAFEQNHAPDLQQFMIWQAKNRIEIKRQMDDAAGAVRIMTVHGAKGLQAPIVILPDTLQGCKGAKTPRLIWPDRSGQPAPVWSPRKDSDSKAYSAIFDHIEAQETAEYKRLFYVAATRAEDRLIICGAEKSAKAKEESWYHYAQRAFDVMGAEVEEEAHPVDAAQQIKFIYHPQLKDADTETDRRAHQQTRDEDITVPGWTLVKAPEEPDPPRPLQPSRPSDPDPAAVSPLAAAQAYRFKRGNLTHVLLQFLPGIAAAMREAKGRAYLARQGGELPEQVRTEILEEVMAILTHPDFAALFGPASQAEAAISGRLPSGRLISGQIDRILITDDEVFIVDYKSNRPPPVHVRDVPQQYLNQMRAYRETLAAIYPQRKIRTALLWTDGCRLMEVV